MKRLLLCLAVALAACATSARADETLAPIPLPAAPAPSSAPAEPGVAPAQTPPQAQPSAASGGKLSDNDDAAPEAPAASSRHFGILYGAGPSVLAIDLEIGHFYGFLSAPLALDLFVNEEFVLGAVGLGATFKLPRDPRWSFDVYAFGVPAWNRSLGYYQPKTMITFGLGAGFHFTSLKGFTLGLKVPLLGSTVGLDNGNFNNAGERALSFYLNSLLSLPIAAFGYRF